MVCKKIEPFNVKGKQYLRTTYLNSNKTEDNLYKFKDGNLHKINVKWYDFKQLSKRRLQQVLKVTNSKKPTLFLLSLLIAASMCLNSSDTPPVFYTLEQVIELMHIEKMDKKYDNELSEESIRWWSGRCGIKFIDVFIEQVLLETDNLKSKICLDNNNLCGMKYAKNRKTTSIGEKYGHALYDNFKQSIMDYKLWQDYHEDKIDLCQTNKEYKKFLIDVGYAEDNNYLSLLVSIRKSI